MIFFVQYIQNLVTLKDNALVKANIPTLLREFALKWYTFKLAKFDCNLLDNNSSMKS